MYHKPFYRIWRPGAGEAYCLSPHYANDFLSLCDGYARLENNLRKILSPSYGLPKRLYPLLKQATFEIQEHLLSLLTAHQIPLANKRKVGIAELRLLNQALRLSDYQVTLTVGEHPLLLQPFKDLETVPPTWFLEGASIWSRNPVHVQTATIDQYIQAVAALHCMLYAQFGPQVALALAPARTPKQGNSYFQATSLFTIVPPEWEDSECYDFDWSLLKNTKDCLQIYPFIMKP